MIEAKDGKRNKIRKVRADKRWGRALVMGSEDPPLISVQQATAWRGLKGESCAEPESVYLSCLRYASFAFAYT